MTLDDSHVEIWREMQRRRTQPATAEPELPLQSAGGGGTSGGDMEARLAKLEASMDYVKADLGRLSGLPVESARIAERVNHLPTKAEVKIDIEAAVDRASARTQRTVAIVGGMVTIAVALITYAPKLASLL